MVADLVERDKPLAYILGTQPFHPLPHPLLIRPPSLIPRPETEHWVSHLASLLTPTLKPSRPFRILDIGTGTGCIPLALVHSLRAVSQPSAIAVDVSASAVRLARENAIFCGLDDKVKVEQLDLFATDFISRVDPTGAGFDLVVSNPPYITREAYATLATSVREWEDRGALVGELSPTEERTEDDGLVFYRRISELARGLLKRGKEGEGPVVAFEVGEGQAKLVEEILRKGLGDGARTELVEDQWKVERLVLGYRK